MTPARDKRYEKRNDASKMSIHNNDNGVSLSPPITIRDIQDDDGNTQTKGMTRHLRFVHHTDQNTSAMNVLANEENEQHPNKEQYLTQQDLEKRNDVVDQFMEDLDLDELTQEDKFFLIQQIEDLNKNIRYCQNASPYIFEEDDSCPRPQGSHSPDQGSQSPFTKSHKSALNEDLSNIVGKHQFGRDKFHKHGARGVRGARRLDIILDEEEENEVEATVASPGPSQLQRGQKLNLEEGLQKDREQGSIFYKKNNDATQNNNRKNEVRSFSPSVRQNSEEIIENNSDNERNLPSPDAISFQQTTMDENGQQKHQILCQK